MSQLNDTSEGSLQSRVEGLMPELTAQLKELMAIPSVSLPGYPESTHASLAEGQAMVTQLFRDAGVQNLETIDLPDTAPVVYGEIPAPPGAPTVLMYSHYDVVPAGDESLWNTPPFEPTEIDGAIHGRGAADTKSNIMALVGALRAWDGKPPVGIKVVVEGLEEVGGAAFTMYPEQEPERFAADVMLIGDMGNIRPGTPTLILGGIERVGNKVPHPAIMLFLALCIGVIVLSQLLAWAGVSATYQVVKPPPRSVESIDVGGSTLPG
jgi:cysteinylglycine-S-conjugate dipeptidase